MQSRLAVGALFWLAWVLLVLNLMGLVGFVFGDTGLFAGFCSLAGTAACAYILHPKGANYWNRYLNS